MTHHDSQPTLTRRPISTSDGLDLRAEFLVVPAQRAVAVLCHPHPLHGGNMFASVIDQLIRTLPALGVSCIRFNFRGVDGSDGRHDYGVGEQRDVAAAVAAGAEVAGGHPLLLAGWSFGADMALTCTDPAVSGWFAVAPPLAIGDAADRRAAQDPRPKQLVVGDHDQFNPPANAQATVADWVNTSVTAVPGADHFFNGSLAAVSSAAESFLADL